MPEEKKVTIELTSTQLRLIREMFVNECEMRQSDLLDKYEKFLGSETELNEVICPINDQLEEKAKELNLPFHVDTELFINEAEPGEWDK